MHLDRAVVSQVQNSGTVLRAGHLNNQGTNQGAAQFVRALEFKRRLRVCNAYPYPTALDIFKGSEQLTGSEPMSSAADILFLHNS